jgi:hypothetical protein
MTTEMIRTFASGRGEDERPEHRNACGVRKKVRHERDLQFLCRDNAGRPERQCPDHAANECGDEARANQENRDIARSLERMPGSGKLPQHRDRYRRLQYCCDTGAGVGEDVPRQRHVRLRQKRETVQELAKKDRRQDPWSEDKACCRRDARGRINRTDLCRAYAENQHHQPADAVGHKHGQVKENRTYDVARRVIGRR